MRQTKLGRKKSNRDLLVKNLASSLVVYERITTTEAKAKLVQGYVERIITNAKKLDNVNAIRMAIKSLGQKKPALKVVEVLKDTYKDTQSGYTRIIKVGPRKGDAAPMAIIELTKKTDDFKAASEKKEKKSTDKKAETEAKAEPKKKTTNKK